MCIQYIIIYYIVYLLLIKQFDTSLSVLLSAACFFDRTNVERCNKLIEDIAHHRRAHLYMVNVKYRTCVR